MRRWDLGEQRKEEKSNEGWREADTGDQQPTAERKKRTAEKTVCWLAGILAPSNRNRVCDSYSKPATLQIIHITTKADVGTTAIHKSHI